MKLILGIIIGIGIILAVRTAEAKNQRFWTHETQHFIVLDDTQTGYTCYSTVGLPSRAIDCVEVK